MSRIRALTSSFIVALLLGAGPAVAATAPNALPEHYESLWAANLAGLGGFRMKSESKSNWGGIGHMVHTAEFQLAGDMIRTTMQLTREGKQIIDETRSFNGDLVQVRDHTKARNLLLHSRDPQFRRSSLPAPHQDTLQNVWTLLGKFRDQGFRLVVGEPEQVNGFEVTPLRAYRLEGILAAEVWSSDELWGLPIRTRIYKVGSTEIETEVDVHSLITAEVNGTRFVYPGHVTLANYAQPLAATDGKPTATIEIRTDPASFVAGLTLTAEDFTLAPQDDERIYDRDTRSVLADSGLMVLPPASATPADATPESVGTPLTTWIAVSAAVAAGGALFIAMVLHYRRTA